MKPKAFFTLTLLFISSHLFSQLSEISFDQKLINSTLIVEGEIIESQSYYGQDGEIYTAHKVQLSKIWRGNNGQKEITIITFGGQVESVLATWYHCLTLQKGERGVFFLQPTLRPSIENHSFPSDVYEVYSSTQGFLKYTTTNQRALAKDPFNSYDDIEEQIFKKIRYSTGQETVVEHRSTSHDDNKKKCIIYSFEPVQSFSADGLKLSADVKVRTTEGSKSLYQSLVVLEYDTTFFGSYIATNGTLEISDGDISSLSNYTLTATDLAYNRLEIKLQATSTFSLFTITDTKSWLARISLTIENILADPNVSFDQNAMEQGNLYYDQQSGQGKPFDCTEIENNAFPLVCPDIVSFSPDTISAGTGDTLTIRGNNFGAATGTLPPLGRAVLLERTDFSGSTGHQWMHPFGTDYIFWSDTMIQIKVPSVGYEFTTGALINNTAGTGIVGVFRDTCIDSTAVQLYVKYAAINTAIANGAGQPVSIPSKLNSQNGEGGYDLYFTPTFQAFDTMAMDAFNRALVTWRCATGVNFRIRAFDSIPAIYQPNACRIDYAPMPAGVPATLVAYTDVDSIDFCGTSINDIWHSYLKKFSLVFNNGTTWHTGTNMPAIDWVDTLDLESIALHELGHAHQLFHSNNAPNLMHYLANSYQRTIEPDDLCGGEHIVHISAVDTAQFCQPAMQAVSAADCGDVSTSVFDISKNELDINIFPNPTNGFLNIQIEESINTGSKRIEVILFNNIGQRIYASRLLQNHEQINIQALPNGIYVGLLSIDAIPTKSFKIIKQ